MITWAFEDMKSWEEVKKQYNLGSKLTGEIIHKAPFGVFLDFGESFHARLEIIEMDNLNYDAYQADQQYKVGEVIEGIVADYMENNQQIRITKKGKNPLDLLV